MSKLPGIAFGSIILFLMVFSCKYELVLLNKSVAALGGLALLSVGLYCFFLFMSRFSAAIERALIARGILLSPTPKTKSTPAMIGLAVSSVATILGALTLYKLLDAGPVCFQNNVLLM